MSNKKVNLIISLKDGVSSKIGGIKKRLSSLGAGLKKIGIAGLAMAGALAVAVGKMTKTFAAQQDAEVALAAALDQVGISGKKLLPIFQKYATGIQRVTKYGDEAILAAMAYGKNLGINTGQLKEATTAAIGLASKYKIDLQTAMMLVGRASQGQTQMLTRYGIVLEETLSPQEKFNKVLEIGAEAFGLAEAETQSLSGAWGRFKNAVGDAQETIISAMADGDGLVETLNNMTTAIGTLIDEGDISFWAKETKTAFQDMWKVVGPIARGIGNVVKFVGGATSEARREDINTRTSFSGLKKQVAAGMSSVRGTNETENAKKEEFKKAFVEAKAAKLKPAKEESVKSDKIAEEALKIESAAKAKIALDERNAELDLMELKAKGDEEAIKRIERIAELKKAGSEAEKNRLLKIYAIEDKKAADAKKKAAPQLGGFRSIAESLLGGGSSVKGAKSKIATAIGFGKQYGLGSENADEAEKGKAAQATALSLLGQGFGKKSIEKRLAQINEVSGFADQLSGAVPAEVTNKLLEDQNDILKSIQEDQKKLLAAG